MADRRVIEVSGLPSRPHDNDFIKDQLLLYFLRARNGGGGEASVRYPTKKEGVALLEFEDEKVAQRILSRRHTLVIDDCAHPLEVRRPQPRSSQFSLTVKTSLDLSYFSNVPEVKRLLERHRLCIFHENSSVLHIKGDFCDLRKCRLDLYKILNSQNLVKQRYSSKEPTASKDLLSEQKGRRASQNVTTTPEQKSPSSSHLSRRLPEGRGHLAQDNFTRDHKNSCGSPIQHSSSTRARAPTPTRVQKVSNIKSLLHTFLVDPAVYRYVTTFRQEAIDAFLGPYNIDMSGKNNEDLTCITLTSLSEQPEVIEKICSDIKKVFHYYHNRLRVEVIELPSNSRFSNAEMTRRIQKYLHDLQICSLPMANNSLQVIGPPERILRFLHGWKETPDKMEQSIFEGSSSTNSRTIGMNRKNLATNGNNSIQPGVLDGGLRASRDIHIRGREKIQEGAGSDRRKLMANDTRRRWK
ncbi:RNA-binding protein 43 [Eleutherodactylus coqui]|uniref:RNA-binding protein 43 n=1 Tax=Eleutherodactylus coqui TaxID=57060 RepID=UPI003461E664